MKKKTKNENVLFNYNYYFATSYMMTTPRYGSPFGNGKPLRVNALQGSRVWQKVCNPVAPLQPPLTGALTAHQVFTLNAVLDCGVHFKSCSGSEGCRCRAVAEGEYRGQCDFMSLARMYHDFPLSEFLRSNITADFTPGPELPANLTKFLQAVPEWFKVQVQIPTEDEMIEVALEFCRRLKEQDDALSKYKYNPSS
jgi:hypothetical protein